VRAALPRLNGVPRAELAAGLRTADRLALERSLTVDRCRS
jgi:hypothetical protein